MEAKRTKLQKELKDAFKNAPDVVKREAIKIFGHSDAYFRALINGRKEDSIDKVLMAIQSMKQAYKNTAKDYNETFHKSQNKIMDMQVEFELLAECEKQAV